LVIFGENEAEYGNPSPTTKNRRATPSITAPRRDWTNSIWAGSARANSWRSTDSPRRTWRPICPSIPTGFSKVGTEVHYLGYYLRWHPQETYYFSVENTGFMPNWHRTEGSYSKYSSLDDKIDWLHYYTAHVKFGLGRATYDSAQEIRNGDITRDEGIALIRRYDGEYPHAVPGRLPRATWTSPRNSSMQVIEEARTPHLWRMVGEEWQLRYPIWETTQNGRP
jgi:hypothetical protein